jgi:hypothetical protein
MLDIEIHLRASAPLSYHGPAVGTHLVGDQGPPRGGGGLHKQREGNGDKHKECEGFVKKRHGGLVWGWRGEGAAGSL